MDTRRALMHFCNKQIEICHREPGHYIPYGLLRVLFHQMQQLPK